MEFTRLTAGTDDQGRRVDRVLRKVLPDTVGLSVLYSALRKGLVRVNGKPSRPNARIAAGDTVEIAAAFLKIVPKIEKAPETSGGKAKYDITPLFQNEHLCIINKPLGLSSQSPELRDFLWRNFLSKSSLSKNFLSKNSLSKSFPAVSFPSLSFIPAPLHRLDTQTTGCLVCSQSIQGARWFSEALRNHVLRKTYLGLAAGTLKKTDRWEDRISGETSSPALTDIAPLVYGLRSTLVQYDIITGKKHQIRIQSSLHGHPLIGDIRYGGPPPPPFFLHAWKITFPQDNPLGLPDTVSAPVPAALEVPQ